MIQKSRLSELMGIPSEKMDLYIKKGVFKPDELGMFSIAESIRAYLQYKEKLLRQQVVDAPAKLMLEKIGFTKVRRQQNEIVLAKQREEVIETDIVIKQASFLFVACRQKLLSIGPSIARKLLHQSDIKKVVDIINNEVNKALKEMANFDKKVVDPDWTGEETE